MNNEQYMEMLMVFHKYFSPIIIEWDNGLKMKCKSFTGLMETDTEPGDDNYIGEYSVGINEIEIIQKGKDLSIEACIYEDSMEISLKNVPQKILLEDGTILWESSVK